MFNRRGALIEADQATEGGTAKEAENKVAVPAVEQGDHSHEPGLYCVCVCANPP